MDCSHPMSGSARAAGHSHPESSLEDRLRRSYSQSVKGASGGSDAVAGALAAHGRPAAAGAAPTSASPEAVTPTVADRTRELYNWDIIHKRSGFESRPLRTVLAGGSQTPEQRTSSLWVRAVDELWTQKAWARRLDLSSNGLIFIPTSISELNNLFYLPDMLEVDASHKYLGLAAKAALTRGMDRSVSAPVSKASPFARSHSQPSSQPRNFSTPAIITSIPQPSTLPDTVSSSSSPSAATSLAPPSHRKQVSFARSCSSSSSSSTLNNAPHHAPRLLPGAPPSSKPRLNGLGRAGLVKSITSIAALCGGRPSSPAEPEVVRKRVTVDLDLAKNSIPFLPSQLFEVNKIVMLTLRNNNLTSLPAAISQLKNLRDLNISANRITYLPSTVLDMDLDCFLLAGNPFIKRDAPGLAYLQPPSQRILHSSSTPPVRTTPTLFELAVRSLLSTTLDTTSRPHLLDQSLIDSGVLASPARLSQEYPFLPLSVSQRIIACMRSAGSTLSSGCPRPTKALLSDPEHEDASLNPWYSPCPNPAHEIEGKRIVFLEPIEVRYEWAALPGTGGGELYPIKWMGCSLGCLNFLEEEEEPEEDFEDDELEGDEGVMGVDAVAQGLCGLALEHDAEEDGFDLDEEDSPF